jgi:hypothetical protein
MVSSPYLARVLRGAVPLAVALMAGCSSPAPTAPTAPANANVAGIWIQPTSNYRWTLTQSGTTVTGTGLGTGVDGSTITGTLTGSVAGQTFAFAEERSWVLGGQVQVAQLHSSNMTVNRGSMSGQVTSLPLFPPYRPASGPVTMVRLLQTE